MFKRRFSHFVVILTAFLFCSTLSLEAGQVDSGFLLSVWFKAQALKEKALSEITKIELEIKRNVETIGKAENLLELARQKGNSKAELIA